MTSQKCLICGGPHLLHSEGSSLGIDEHNDDLQAVLENGKKHGVPIITCSWGVASVRRRSTKEWSNLLIFFDKGTLVPFFIYDFGDSVSLKAMAARLIKTKHFSDEMREKLGL